MTIKTTEESFAKTDSGLVTISDGTNSMLIGNGVISTDLGVVVNTYYFEYNSYIPVYKAIFIFPTAVSTPTFSFSIDDLYMDAYPIREDSVIDLAYKDSWKKLITYKSTINFNVTYSAKWAYCPSGTTQTNLKTKYLAQEPWEDSDFATATSQQAKYISVPTTYDSTQNSFTFVSDQNAETNSCFFFCLLAKLEK